VVIMSRAGKDGQQLDKTSFQLDLFYKGRAPAIKEQIVDMSLNGSGIRDTARVLKISTTTVINTLKKKSLNSPR
jgi:insertion element IS1 protein InsB